MFGSNRYARALRVVAEDQLLHLPLDEFIFSELHTIEIQRHLLLLCCNTFQTVQSAASSMLPASVKQGAVGQVVFSGVVVVHVDDLLLGDLARAYFGHPLAVQKGQALVLVLYLLELILHVFGMVSVCGSMVGGKGMTDQS